MFSFEDIDNVRGISVYEIAEADANRLHVMDRVRDCESILFKKLTTKDTKITKFLMP